jgi:GMP synthase-like glutamine amidotransferase
VSAPRLVIVDPAVETPELRGEAEVARGWPGPVTVWRPALEPGQGPGPETPCEAEAVVVMGSAASVHDAPERAPWLAPLAAWVDRLLAPDGPRVPLLGICFGHQLVAQRAGGAVGFRVDAAAPPLRAIVSTRLSGCRLLPGEQPLTVVASHREIVTAPPPGWEVVGRRPDGTLDALQHLVLPFFAVQFHPEAGPEFLARRRIGADGPSAPEAEAAFADGGRLLEAFRRHALAARYP